MRTITRNIVGAFVFSSDDKVLLGLHDPKAVYPGFWAVPGGGVDEGETQEVALRREVMEEVGIDIAPHKVSFLDSIDTDTREKTLRETDERILADMRFYNYAVHVDKPADQIQSRPNEEFMELRWIPVSELPNTKLAPKTRAALERMGYAV